MHAVMTTAAEVGWASVQVLVQFLLMRGNIKITLLYFMFIAALRVSSRTGRARSAV
jgi:hypothetical protein